MWYGFSPIVFIVLMGFTIALPLSIIVYLFVNRGGLYSTAVYQHVGFLYDPYNRSAPWWAIHDVVLKMLLTGDLPQDFATTCCTSRVLACEMQASP